MDRDSFINMYVSSYVADKMARVNRQEVQHADLVEKHTYTAISEANRAWNIIQAQRTTP